MLKGEISRRERIGSAPPGAIAAIALAVVLIEGISSWLSRSDSVEQRLSESWLSMDLISGGFEIAIALGVIFLVSATRREDLGLSLSQVGVGAAVCLAVWALAQLTQMIIGLARAGHLSLYDGWSAPGLLIYPALTILVAEAIPEELIWRAVVLIWVIDLFERKIFVKDPFIRLGGALLISSLGYAISELPDRSLEVTGNASITADLTLLTVTGIFFGLLYLRTRNLWIVIGVHLLSVWPMPLVDPWFDAARLSFLTAAILLVPDPATRLTVNRSPRARRQTGFSRG